MPADLSSEELDIAVAEILGWKWMRYYDLDYVSPDGPLRRTLCNPAERWLEPPKYVECDLSDPRQRKLQPHYHGPKFSTPDCSGLVPVLAWLTANWPIHGPGFQAETFGDGWMACLDYYEGSGGSDPSPAEYQLCADGATLAEAACRLVLMRAEQIREAARR
jgi:hypothetical protein